MTNNKENISQEAYMAEDLRSELGAAVSRLREEQHINKSTFALMVGISRPFLNDIESGKADPRISLVKRMSDALGVPIETLLIDNVGYQPRSNI